MKKFITAILAIFIMISLAGCGGGSGDRKGFLADAEGDWYIRGNSSSDMLSISEDGAWVFYEVPEDSDERVLSDSGAADNISYDKEYEEWVFEGENQTRYCTTTDDRLLIFGGNLYIPAEESCGISERFDGDWYLDGDRNQNYYKFEAGVWRYYEAIGMGHSSTNSGYISYRGGDTKALTVHDSYEDDSDVVFSIVGDNEIKTKDSDQTYLRLAEVTFWDDEDVEDFGGGESESGGIVTSSYYYWDGDEDSNSLYFYDDNTVDLDAPDEDTVEGTYSIDGDALTITWDTGEEITLTIEDGGSTVVSAQGEYYYLAD